MTKMFESVAAAKAEAGSTFADREDVFIFNGSTTLPYSYDEGATGTESLPDLIEGQGGLFRLASNAGGPVLQKDGVFWNVFSEGTYNIPAGSRKILLVNLMDQQSGVDSVVDGFFPIQPGMEKTYETPGARNPALSIVVPAGGQLFIMVAH